MNILPSDRELFFPHVLRIEASAGSGKTFLLACRFVQFLLSQRISRSHLQNLLAITFTNEATAEMRRRILKLLKQSAFEEAEAKEILFPLVDLPQIRIKELALNQIDEIFARYDEWQVRTVDSYVYRLIQAAPQELGLLYQDGIQVNEAPLRAAALDRILLNSAQDSGLWELLRDLVDHYLFIQGRSSWWPREELLRMLESFNAIESTYGLRFDTEKNQKSALALGKKLSSLAQEFNDFTEANGLLLKSHNQKALSQMVAGDLNQAFSKKIWDKEDLKDLFLKGTSVSQQLLDKWQALRKVAEKYAEVRALEIPGPYLKLLEPWRNQLTSLKSESRSIFLSDINILARRLLTEFILPEVIFRLGDRLYHFLIDEFQDTSILQWKNLFPLIDNALAQGGSLFCVGDRKQLLYRWRGSDLAVFQDGPKAFKSIEDSGLIDFVLSYNWRSREVLLNFVSRVFEKDNLQRWIKDESSISNVLDPARAGNIFSGALQQVPAPHAVSHKGGIVRLEIIESDGSLEEIREESKLSLLRLLKQDLLMRYSLNDVLILVRDNQEVQEFSHRLISASIPVCSHRQLDIREDALIREILATLCFLEMPTDDQAFAALITGDVMSEAWKNDAKGLNPEEWLELQKFRSQGLKAEYLYQRFQADFPHLWAGILQEVFRSVGFLPLYDLVSMLVCKLNLIQRFPDHFLAFSHLMELLHVYEPEYGGDLRAFMQWMNNGPEEIFGIKTPQEIDAVRVMTIHKAKGLEARVAILPFATLKVRGDGRIYHVDQDHLTVWHTDQGLRNVSQRLSGLYKDKCGKAWLDELNVLYVALTRAKDELYLFLPRKAEGRQKNRLISLLNPLLNGELVAEWGQKVENKSLETSTVDIREQSTGIDFNQHIPGEKAKDINKGWTWPNYLVRRATDFKVLLSPNRKSAAVVGDFVHRLLAKIDSPLRCSSNFEQVFEFLQNIFMSMSRGPDIYAGHGIDLGSIARTICHPLARPLFWTANGCQIWVEKEVADSSGVLFRPDRMVIGQNTLWVGEYKTGMTARTRDKEQLFEYLRLLSQLYPDLGVKGVILYVDQEEVIEVDQIKD